jgi:cytidylate kinase
MNKSILAKPFSQLPVEKRIVTIDGLSGVGATTVATILAQALDCVHLNGGAYYRTLAYLALRSNIFKETDNIDTNHPNFHLLLELAKNIRPFYENGRYIHNIGGEPEDLTSEIFTSEIGVLSAKVSPFLEIREAIKAAQKLSVWSAPTVIEGRDAGHMFPSAILKVWLKCSDEVCANRRTIQLIENGNTHANYQDELKKMMDRNNADQTRLLDPAIPAHDAIILSTELLSQQFIVKIILDNLDHRL